MKQLTTLSLFLFLLLNLASTNIFSKEKNPTLLEEESITINNLFAVLDPTEPSCATCSDGTIAAIVSGGVAPYNFNWSTGANTSTITNLAVGSYELTVTDQLGCVTMDSIALAFSGSNVTLTLNVATLATTCFGSADGNAVAVASGGIMPYTYIWSTGDSLNTASNLMAGIYTATVADAVGDIVIDTFEIIEPTQLIVNTTSSSGCTGPTSGSAMANVTGGVFPYSYAWSTGDSTATIAGLSTGTFGVTVTDANGCVAEFSDFLVQPTQVNVNPVPTAPSCFANSDGIITASVWGGSQPYTFLWNDGQTTQTAMNLIPGVYSVTVTDSLGCTAIGNVVLDGGNPIDVTVQGISTVSCFGDTDGALLVNAFGGSGVGYTYLWANGDMGAFVDSLASGFHTLTITDNGTGCTHVDSVFVNSPLALNVFLNPTPTCGGVSEGVVEAVPSGGTLPYTFLWDTGATTQTITGLPVGNYSVTVTDINGCSIVNSVQVTEIPNAFSGTINTTSITCTNGNDGTAMAIPSGGLAPYSYAWSTTSTDSLIFGLTAGSYTVTITDANGCNIIQAASVLVPSPVVANETVVNSGGCTGGVPGSISVAPVGGTAPYTYLWSDGSTGSSITGLTAGTYTVDIIDANNCVQTFSYNVGGSGTDNPPVVLTQDVAVALDANGIGSITVSDVDAGTTDDCGLASVTIDQMTFDCSHIGTQTVTLTAVDGSGQTDIGTAIVTIVDTLLPTVVTQNITIGLDATGTATISTMDVNNGSADNCGITNMALDIMQFDCSHIGTQMVTLTVADASGNIQTGTATVTVEDAIAPVVTTQDVTISLGASNMASITTMDINNGSVDNCGIANMTLDMMQFDCSNVGMNTVTLMVTDQNGNIQTGTAIVTVLDDSTPSVVTNNPTIYLDAQGMATITPADVVTITTNCNSDSTTSVTLGLTQFDCSSLGMNLVSIEIIDANGNASNFSSLVTVADTIPATINCPGPLSAFACDMTTVIDFDAPTISGNCDVMGMPTLVSGIPSGSPFPVGTTTNTYSYTDASGNTITCSFDITIFQGTIDIVLDSLTQPTAGNNDGAIDITVTGANPLTYEWFLNGTLVSTDEDPTGLAVGVYEVIVTDVNGCTQTMMIDFMTAINDPEIVKNIQIYPNPTSDQLFVNIDLPSIENTEIQLFNLDGRLLLNKNISASQNQIELNVSNFANGIYILKITINDEIVTKRVTVSR